MRRVIVVLIVIPLITSASFAEDYIRLGIDSIPAGATNFEIPFFLEHTCSSPWNVVGVSNGFTLTAVGSVTWSFVDFVPAPNADEWFSLGGLLFTSFFDGTSPDGFLTGGAGWPSTGIPYVTDTIYFRLYLDIGPGEGAIQIDSAFVGTMGEWKWSSMNCGEGGAPDRPLFVGKRGDDGPHPHIITVFEPPCGDANTDGVVDIDDPVFLVEYVFSFGPAPNPLLKADCDCSGGDVPVDIDDVVHLMDYILRGGPEPCDLDGDGVPDC